MEHLALYSLRRGLTVEHLALELVGCLRFPRFNDPRDEAHLFDVLWLAVLPFLSALTM